MHYKYLAQLDKDWLRDSISDKEKHLSDVNGALTSEAISDLFVFVNGGITASFAVASRSLIPLAANPLPMIQLALAYKTIKSLIDQQRKIQNDLHVMNAILQIDEETPENITAMVRGYIEIHGNPDSDGPPSHLDIKTLSPDALRAIQKNFRHKHKKTSLPEKIKFSAGFLQNEFANAATMVGKTLAHPVELGKSVYASAKNIKPIYDHWQEIKETRNSKTLRETYNMMLRRARREDGMKKELPKELGTFFSSERRNQLYYLHQQQASLRTVSRMRVETATGFCACAGIIGISLYSAARASNTVNLLGSIYTVAASLPSLRVLGDELNSLTKTAQKYGPRVNRAAADFMMGMPGR